MYRFLVTALLLCTGGVLQAQQQEGAAAFSKDIRQPGVQVFDVRTAEEYNTGHLPNALQADYTNKTEFNDRVKYLDKQKPVYIYCLSGGRSSKAAQWMRENGFSKVIELENGVNAWKQAGLPLEGVNEKKPQLTMDAYNKGTAKGWVLTDVGAAWCPPCKQLEPVLTQFLKQHQQVKLMKVDGGNDTDVMKTIGAKGLPTLILYKDGKEVWRKQGVATAEELAAAVK
ncbi:rhodanese-like domain-containing protein [Chitinophaga qingshengii]|uniref:Thioredoxin fold domain-containing protein n=1 Tax=Chitinophaga qingshengii TaxID=1569794 RepID=A0ABR7TJP8_9BACT|nr:rhodanese-like domain-containing protein [Chitinophaga qingshengii]MBC9930695.1 thioredoxin fold domain-containing protein [Chitinophaga qingshengii]